ncbi:MAG: hypothetical protein GY861_13445 [bacterium]|nr:hypothetical protein [bacterium]
MKLYDNSDHELNPITITPFALYDKNISSPEVRLRNVLKLSRFYERTDYWIKSRESILENIINLKNNFKPAGEKYTKKEIKEFVDLVSIQQVILRNLEFAQNTVNIEKKEIDINQFPSIITKSYVVFYKFYSDNKRPSSSDVIDIIIASLLPYVDFFITEGHLCEIIKKVQSIHNYLTNLQSFSIRQIMKEINSSGV